MELEEWIEYILDEEHIDLENNINDLYYRLLEIVENENKKEINKNKRIIIDYNKFMNIMINYNFENRNKIIDNFYKNQKLEEFYKLKEKENSDKKYTFVTDEMLIDSFNMMEDDLK